MTFQGDICCIDERLRRAFCDKTAKLGDECPAVCGKWHFRAMSLSTFRDEKQAKRCYDFLMSVPCLWKAGKGKNL